MTDTKLNAILKPLESALNAYLMCDENSSKRLARAAGKSLLVKLKPFDLHFACTIHPESISISTVIPENPAATIQGTPLKLMGAAISRSSRQTFFADDLTIQGDAEFAQQVTELFDQVEIDWEEHLARLIGDVPAYQISKLKRQLLSWVNRSRSSLTQDISDFLHEEAAWFPVREELNEFFTEVDELRMHTDRLESRITRLKNQTNKEDTQ